MTNYLDYGGKFTKLNDVNHFCQSLTYLIVSEF